MLLILPIDSIVQCVAKHIIFIQAKHAFLLEICQALTLSARYFVEVLPVIFLTAVKADLRMGDISFLVFFLEVGPPFDQIWVVFEAQC